MKKKLYIFERKGRVSSHSPHGPVNSIQTPDLSVYDPVNPIQTPDLSVHGPVSPIQIPDLSVHWSWSLSWAYLPLRYQNRSLHLAMSIRCVPQLLYHPKPMS